ncbi:MULTISPECIES: hypothetical protein [Clostridium]|uniref:Uncharacterized protein n=1 Tax=Clostridium butyricum E4 str. BoNT E BL5262 TaxID=632245 RepID=C4II64_CLOBU|nr:MULTISPECIES: hypothetical protein [Clostridium]APF24693.1 hypothetical protein NPD4_1250 [Clostridium butyricum]EDT75817.1 hypothetical protein CBY_2864 [Clostridium butyricum 5521]EEP54268.1 conserved hypothetical protein [Clostridium butyricum E4 str. BoNT E BL5262]MDU0323815.1 hypothetical protein [Clostridium butyricum]MDU3087993.1 hypothetical protein [Clostridium sp.]
MKYDEIKVNILDLEDEKGFKELLAEMQVEAVMRLCPEELRMQVLDNALAVLKGEKAVTE